jgi:hypothetical protein
VANLGAGLVRTSMQQEAVSSTLSSGCVVSDAQADEVRVTSEVPILPLSRQAPCRVQGLNDDSSRLADRHVPSDRMLSGSVVRHPQTVASTS